MNQGSENDSIGKNTIPIEEFCKNGLSSIIESTKCTNVLPSGSSRDAYCACPTFGKVIENQSDKILGIISKVLKHENIRGHIQRREPDERFEMILECNDLMLERINSNLDELAGIKKNPETILIESRISSVESKNSGSWNTKKNAINQSSARKKIEETLCGAVKKKSHHEDKIRQKLHYLELNKKIQLEEKKILSIQRKIESIRLLKAVFERIEHKNIISISSSESSSSSSHYVNKKLTKRLKDDLSILVVDESETTDSVKKKKSKKIKKLKKKKLKTKDNVNTSTCQFNNGDATWFRYGFYPFVPSLAPAAIYPSPMMSYCGYDGGIEQLSEMNANYFENYYDYEQKNYNIAKNDSTKKYENNKSSSFKSERKIRNQSKHRHRSLEKSSKCESKNIKKLVSTRRSQSSSPSKKKKSRREEKKSKSRELNQVPDIVFEDFTIKSIDLVKSANEIGQIVRQKLYEKSRNLEIKKRPQLITRTQMEESLKVQASKKTDFPSGKCPYQRRSTSLDI